MNKLKRAATAMAYGAAALVLPLTALVAMSPTAAAAQKQWFDCYGHSYEWCQQSKRTVAHEGYSTSSIQWSVDGCTSPPESNSCGRGFYYW